MVVWHATATFGAAAPLVTGGCASSVAATAWLTDAQSAADETRSMVGTRVLQVLTSTRPSWA